MKILKYIVTIILATTCHAFAQNEIKPLTIGDRVPDFIMEKVINYKKPFAKLSDFKSKLTIIDFWATWCAPCVRELPRLDSLQTEFKNKIVIITITSQKEDLIKKTLSNIPSLKRIKIPFVIEDKLVHKFFPHKSVPHDVIINEKGEVIAITTADNISRESILNLLNGKLIKFKLKKDSLLDDDMPLFISKDAPKVLYHSLFTARKDGLPAGSSLKFLNDNLDSIVRFYATNLDIINLYKRAYNVERNGYFYENSQIDFKVKDINRFWPPDYNTHPVEADKWKIKNTFCYDLIVPPALTKSMYGMMQKDLDIFFNLKSNMISEKRQCLILTSLDEKKYKSKGGMYYFDRGVKSKWIMSNISMVGLLYYMNIRRSNKLIINETGYKGNVDLTIDPNSVNNYKVFRQQLNQQGLDLLLEEREIPILVLEEQ